MLLEPQISLDDYKEQQWVMDICGKGSYQDGNSKRFARWGDRDGTLPKVFRMRPCTSVLARIGSQMMIGRNMERVHGVLNMAWYFHPTTPVTNLMGFVS